MSEPYVFAKGKYRGLSLTNPQIPVNYLLWIAYTPGLPAWLRAQCREEIAKRSNPNVEAQP